MARKKRQRKSCGCSRGLGAMLEAGEGRGEFDVPTFKLVCPSGRQIGIGFAMPHRSDRGEGSTLACLDRFEGKGRGCREFPTRRLAVAWLAAVAKDEEC